jgi:hypothetical protein
LALEYTFIVAALVVATRQSAIIIHKPKKILDDLIIMREVLVLVKSRASLTSSSTEAVIASNCFRLTGQVSPASNPPSAICSASSGGEMRLVCGT